MRNLKFYLAGARSLVLALGCFLPQMRADEITLTPVHDTSLIEIQPDHNNGGEGWFIAGTTQNGTRNRGLLQFDLTGVIPANAVITSVDLALNVTRMPRDFVISPFSLHRMLVSWGEGDKIDLENGGGQGAPAAAGEATWNNRFFGGPSWAAPGGAPDVDYVGLSSAIALIVGTGDSPYHFTDPKMVADVQSWLNNPQSSFGWIFMSDDEGSPFTARRFGSREDPDALPLLNIQFEVVPEPGVAALFGLALALVGGAAWRKRKPTRPGRAPLPLN